MRYLEGIIFNIQRFTVHDGPGIRTELFLKGCPLRCAWCSNPESFISYPQIGVYSTQCIGKSGCGECLNICPKEDALVFADDNIVSAINRDVCDNCLRCYDACPSDALKRWGQRITAQEAVKAILADRNFYARSGGGVTISGGEPLVQSAFVAEILSRCNKEGIHTCVESVLHVPREALDAVMPYTDLLITDIKHMNSDIHKMCTGVGNELILENIKYVALTGKPMILRLPIIPDINDTFEHIDLVSDLIIKHLMDSVLQVQFLRFRPLGEEKYKSLGMPYRMAGVSPPREKFEAHIIELVNRMQERKIPAVAGTNIKIKEQQKYKEI